MSINCGLFQGGHKILEMRDGISVGDSCLVEDTVIPKWSSVSRSSWGPCAKVRTMIPEEGGEGWS